MSKFKVTLTVEAYMLGEDGIEELRVYSDRDTYVDEGDERGFDVSGCLPGSSEAEAVAGFFHGLLNDEAIALAVESLSRTLSLDGEDLYHMASDQDLDRLEELVRDERKRRKARAERGDKAWLGTEAAEGAGS